MTYASPGKLRNRTLTLLTKLVFFLMLLSLGAAGMFGQTCNALSSPVFVHQEGLSELVADINVSCPGATGGGVALIYVTLNANVTNRLDANGNLTGITLTGSGVTNLQPPVLTSATTLSFSSVSVTGPSPSFIISGIRVAVPSVSGGGANANITAKILATQLNFTNQPFAVALSGPTLATSVFNYGPPCAGSPTPATVDIPTLITTGTISSTVRVTENSVQAFQPITTGADFGMRFTLSLSGYPTGATVYVPDVIVGKGAPAATSSGTPGGQASGGIYSPVTHTLLLVRVVGADATGNGGILLFSTPPSIDTTYTTAFQVPLVKGAASVTYEVVDANNAATDSGQIPIWVALPAYNCAAAPPALTAVATVAPVSTVAVATLGDPIPRYIASVPASDCSIIGDCTASYFPKLQASPTSITLNGASQGSQQTTFITLTNGGSNQYSFTASVAYQQTSGLSSANWLSLSAASGVVGTTVGVTSFNVGVTVDPSALLVQGAYQATINIDAGAAGTASIPVTFNVGPSLPTIQAIVNSANGQAGPVTANSFATIYGVNLVPKSGKPATVSVNGFNATVSYDGQPSANGPSQINFLVPQQVAGAASVGTIATIDGVPTNNFPVQLVPNAPAVFNPGILNQDNSVNLPSVPASRGDIIQVFLTGLNTPDTTPVTVTIGTQSQSGSQIYYAGPVVSIPGLEQINVQVPPSLSFTGSSVNLAVCIPGSGTQPACSVPVSLYVKQ